MDFSTLTYKYTQSIVNIRNELQSEVLLNCQCSENKRNVTIYI